MIYVSSDWHGVELEKIKSLLEKVNFSDDDTLFILGDVIDRGEHGVELLKYIMFQPNIILIRGNHEQMLLNCSFLFDEITDESIKNVNVNHINELRVWQMNGGESTIDGLHKETPEMRKMLLEFIEETPFYDTVSVGEKNFLLIHAGLATDENGVFHKFSDSTEYDLIWARPNFYTEYSHDFTTICGHTPTHFYGHQYKGRILRRGTWIDIDVGAASGGTPAFLRLDDMAEFYLD